MAFCMFVVFYTQVLRNGTKIPNYHTIVTHGSLESISSHPVKLQHHG